MVIGNHSSLPRLLLPQTLHSFVRPKDDWSNRLEAHPSKKTLLILILSRCNVKNTLCIKLIRLHKNCLDPNLLVVATRSTSILKTPNLLNSYSSSRALSKRSKNSSWPEQSGNTTSPWFRKKRTARVRGLTSTVVVLAVVALRAHHDVP